MIKDKKICNILKKWAEANDIKNVVCYIGNYDHGGICFYEGIIEFMGYPYRLRIHFTNSRAFNELQNKRLYTIEELVGGKA